jgi:hypothetical protein
MANEFIARRGLISLGSLTVPYTAVTSTYNVGENDYVVDATSGTFTITLPTAVDISGKNYLIKNSGSGTITVNCDGSETIDGIASITLREEGSLQVISNGLNWIIAGTGSVGNIENIITVGMSGSSDVDYYSVKEAVDSISGATSANTYTVRVYAGQYYEDQIIMKSYVAIVGDSSISTVIEANDPNQSLIIMADQSMVTNVQLQGSTGTGVACVVYSSSTTPQLNAISYVEDVRFGANYTHAKTVGTGGGNCIMQCSNVKYGGYPFTIGFYVTNDGSGIGRMQLRNVTSTNGGVTTTTGLIFAKADQPGCAFIVNGCLLTKSVGAAAGTGFWMENGSSLRATSVNFQRWTTGIYVPNTGTGPSIDAIALNFENCTTDINIENVTTTGKVSGNDTFLKTIIPIDAPIYVVNQDPRIITVGTKGSQFTSIKAAVDWITGSSIDNRFLVSVGPGQFVEDEIDLTGN